MGRTWMIHQLLLHPRPATTTFWSKSTSEFPVIIRSFFLHLPVKNLLAFSKSAFEKIYHGFNTEMHHNIIHIHNNVLWDIHEWSIRYYYIRDRWPPPFDPNLLQSFRLRFAPSFFLHLHVKDLLAFSTFALEEISHDLTRKCVITFKSITVLCGTDMISRIFSTFSLDVRKILECFVEYWQFRRTKLWI